MDVTRSTFNEVYRIAEGNGLRVTKLKDSILYLDDGTGTFQYTLFLEHQQWRLVSGKINLSGG